MKSISQKIVLESQTIILGRCKDRIISDNIRTSEHQNGKIIFKAGCSHSKLHSDGIEPPK